MFNALLLQLASWGLTDTTHGTHLRKAIIPILRECKDIWQDNAYGLFGTTVDQYLTKMMDPAFWGGDFELRALCDLFECGFDVVSVDRSTGILQPTWSIGCSPYPGSTFAAKSLRGHHYEARMFLCAWKDSHFVGAFVRPPRGIKEIQLQAHSEDRAILDSYLEHRDVPLKTVSCHVVNGYFHAVQSILSLLRLTADANGTHEVCRAARALGKSEDIIINMSVETIEGCPDEAKNVAERFGLQVKCWTVYHGEVCSQILYGDESSPTKVEIARLGDDWYFIGRKAGFVLDAFSGVRDALPSEVINDSTVISEPPPPTTLTTMPDDLLQVIAGFVSAPNMLQWRIFNVCKKWRTVFLMSLFAYMDFLREVDETLWLRQFDEVLQLGAAPDQSIPSMYKYSCSLKKCPLCRQQSFINTSTQSDLSLCPRCSESVFFEHVCMPYEAQALKAFPAYLLDSGGDDTTV